MEVEKTHFAKHRAKKLEFELGNRSACEGRRPKNCLRGFFPACLPPFPPRLLSQSAALVGRAGILRLSKYQILLYVYFGVARSRVEILTKPRSQVQDIQDPR